MKRRNRIPIWDEKVGCYRLELTRGKSTIFDMSDYHLLQERTWCVNPYGYAINSKFEFMHLLIMGKKPGYVVDHINGDPLDNRRKNLQHCKQSQNIQKRGKFKGNNSGYKGVCWSAGKRKWRATIEANKKSMHLGYFTDKAEAARAYNQAATKHHGNFAVLNEVPQCQ